MKKKGQRSFWSRTTKCSRHTRRDAFSCAMDRLSETYRLPPEEGGPTASGLAGRVRVEAMTNPCGTFPLLMAWRETRAASGRYIFVVRLMANGAGSLIEV